MTDPRRRNLLRALAAAALWPAVASAAESEEEARARAKSSHFPFGPVVPARQIPPWPLRTDRAEASDFTSLLQGKVTALQLMFTGCSAICPIQGVLFKEAQQRLKPTSTPMQFVSISIDPLADTPQALAAWLKKFGASPGWSAAAPRITDLDALQRLLNAGGETVRSANDPHSGQVFIVNRRVELVYRTPSMPKPEQIVAAMMLAT